MDILLALLVVVCGWIPPVVVFYLSYRLAQQSRASAQELAHQTLREARKIKRQTLSEAQALRDDVDLAVEGLESRMIMRMKGERVLIFEEIKSMEKRVYKKMKNVQLSEDYTKALKKDLRKSITHCIDGKLGKEIQETRDALLNDPVAGPYVEQRMQQGGGGGGMGMLILDIFKGAIR